jgi:branched-chain amino acid transport system permease protein
MLGAYCAYTFGNALAVVVGRGALSFWLGLLAAALGVALIGALVERILLKRLYDAPELMQLTATFAVVLIIRDVALYLWGAEDLLGPRAPGLAGTIEILGHSIPQYDLFLIVAAPAVLVALTLLVTRTRFGMLIRAAVENRALIATLGIDQARLFTAVFALGAFLAGLAGALQLPREPANLGMDLAIIADAFVVTVVGGLGSIPGAFLAASLIGVTKAVGSETFQYVDRINHTRAGRSKAMRLVNSFATSRTSPTPPPWRSPGVSTAWSVMSPTTALVLPGNSSPRSSPPVAST